MILTIVALLADTVARVSTVWANHGAQFKCFCSCIGCFITEGTCPILRHYLPVQSLLLLYFVWLYTEALSHWNSASCCHFHGPYNGPLWCKCAKHTLSMGDSLHLHVCWLRLTADDTDSAYIHHILSIWAMKQSWVDLPDMCIRAHSCTMVIHCHLNHNFFFFKGHSQPAPIPPAAKDGAIKAAKHPVWPLPEGLLPWREDGLLSVVHKVLHWQPSQSWYQVSSTNFRLVGCAANNGFVKWMIWLNQ